MNPLINHLWQSTVFALAVALAAMVLRRNAARLRYWLWLAASLKFLIPFSLFVTMGGRVVTRPAAAPVLPALAVVRVYTWFAPASTAAPPPPATAPSYGPLLLGIIWAAGSLLLLCRWYRRWRAIRNSVRNATPVQVHPLLPALSSRATVEPGVFGLFRPVLVLPDGLAESLTPEQLRSIVNHELCHARHRDNLTAALHMYVETLFWFYPLVWWIGAKLVAERERACDENVLSRGSRPSDYAQGIVNVCKTYRELPLRCVAGVTGADLKQRIREIITWRGPRHLSFARKSMLAIAGTVAITVPLILGVIRAQTLPPPPAYTYEVVSIHQASPGQRGMRIGPGPSGGLRTQNTTAMQLLTFAYRVQDYQIADAPGWMTSDRFDVSFTPDKTEPTVAPGAGPKELETFIGRNQQRMQAVLRDRFGLVLRAETHELPIYALVPAKGGLKLTPSVDGKKGPRLSARPGGVEGIGVTVSMLAGHLSTVLGRPVHDETDTGDRQYDFQLEFTPETAGPAGPGEPPPSSDAPSLFTALTEQLGLRLEPRKGSVQVFVVEKIQRPTEN